MPTAASAAVPARSRSHRSQLFIGDGITPVKRFRTGDDVRIRLDTISAEKPIPKPVIGIEIEALGGATVTAPCTRDVGMIPEALSGEGTIEVQLDAVSLLPGTYDLHTSITDFNRSHIYDNLHLAFRFDVMSGKPYEIGRRRDRSPALDDRVITITCPEIGV